MIRKSRKYGVEHGHGKQTNCELKRMRRLWQVNEIRSSFIQLRYSRWL